MADRKDDLEILREAISEAIEGVYKVGGIPRLFINAEMSGVVVPDFVRKKFGARLVIDLRAEYPMNLAHTAEALEATLAFGGRTMRCVFPWRAIFAIVDAHTGVGVSIEMNVPKPEPTPAQDDSKERAQKLGLRMVKGGKA